MFGLVPQQVPAAADVADVYYLWPDNEPSWYAWLLVQGRWRRFDEGLHEQLDMPGCETLLRAYDYRWHDGPRDARPDDLRRALADISRMEPVAMQVWAETSRRRMRRNRRRGR